MRWGYCPEDHVAIQALPGELSLEAEGTDTTHWYDGTNVVPKTVLPTLTPTSVPADGTSVTSASGLPNPTIVTISGPAADSFEVTDGTVEVSFDTPGNYRVRLTAGVPYLASETIIHAT